MTNNYARACTEVLELLKYLSKEEYSKIPPEKINFFKKYMDTDYSFSINPNIDLSKQNLSIEANSIIVILFRDYFATDYQKIKIKEILKLNQEKLELEKKEKYNSDNIFEKKIKKENKINNTQLVEYKQSFFVKFKNFIMKLLHINNK